MTEIVVLRSLAHVSDVLVKCVVLHPPERKGELMHIRSSAVGWCNCIVSAPLGTNRFPSAHRVIDTVKTRPCDYNPMRTFRFPVETTMQQHMTQVLQSPLTAAPSSAARTPMGARYAIILLPL